MHVLTCHGSYIINLITTLSVSAISSNGTVRGGGAYYLISRSLGPEFGGSIGLVFYLGFVFNTGMNAVGLIDCIVNNFGETSGTMFQVVPESFVSPQHHRRVASQRGGDSLCSGTGISMLRRFWYSAQQFASQDRPYFLGLQISCWPYSWWPPFQSRFRRCWSALFRILALESSTPAYR